MKNYVKYSLIVFLMICLIGCVPFMQQKTREPELEAAPEPICYEYSPIMFPIAYGFEAFHVILDEYAQDGWRMVHAMVILEDSAVFMIWEREQQEVKE